MEPRTYSSNLTNQTCESALIYVDGAGKTSAAYTNNIIINIAEWVKTCRGVYLYLKKKEKEKFYMYQTSIECLFKFSKAYMYEVASYCIELTITRKKLIYSLSLCYFPKARSVSSSRATSFKYLPNMVDSWWRLVLPPPHFDSTVFLFRLSQIVVYFLINKFSCLLIFFKNIII